MSHGQGRQRLHLHGRVELSPDSRTAGRIASLTGIVFLAACGADSGSAPAAGSLAGELPAGAQAHLERLRDSARADLPADMSMAQVSAGAEIFHVSGPCHVCHGEDGRGARDVGPDLSDQEWWNSDGSWGGIENTIVAGVTEAESHNSWGAVMPARGGADLDDDEVRAVAAYVWTLRLAHFMQQ